MTEHVFSSTTSAVTSKIDVPIIILSGGLGTRLQSVVKNSPKIMAPIGDKLFIDILLDWLSQQGATSVIFSLGVMAEQVIAHIEKVKLHYLNNLSLCVDYIVEKEPLGTLGAVAHCLRNIDIQACLVMNGDTWLDVNLLEFVQIQKKNQATQSLVCKKVEDVARFGHLELLDEYFVKSFNEKQTHLHHEGWINAGIYYFSFDAIQSLKHYQKGSIETDFLAKNCKNLRYFKVNEGAFIDIGTPESFKIAPSILKEYIS